MVKTNVEASQACLYSSSTVLFRYLSKNITNLAPAKAGIGDSMSLANKWLA